MKSRPDNDGDLPPAPSQEGAVFTGGQYRNILNSLIDGLLILDDDHVILTANDTYCRMIGYRREELVGKKVWELLDPESLPRHQADVPAARRMGGVHKRTRHVCKGGAMLDLDMSITFMAAEEGRHLLIAIYRDVTAQAEMELRLAGYHERLEVYNSVMRAILKAESIEAIAEAVTGNMERLIPCRRASVALIDRAAARLTVFAVRQEDGKGSRKGLSYPIFDAAYLERFLRGEAIAVEDIAALPAKSVHARRFLRLGIRSLLMCPILFRGELFGTLNVGRAEPCRFTDEEIEIVNELSERIAVAVQQSTLLREAKDAQVRLARFSSGLVEVQERERRHIARELHDEIGQVLTTIRLTLRRGRADAEPTHAKALDEAGALVDELIDSVRTISQEIRPAMLDDLGLLPTLVWFIDRFSTRAGIRVCFEHSGIGARFAPEIETTAYRIVQESLTNVARHAGIDSAAVKVWSSPLMIFLEISDHGRGFSMQAGRASEGFGLAAMKERTALIGGRFSVRASPGKGTQVLVELPLATREERL